MEKRVKAHSLAGLLWGYLLAAGALCIAVCFAALFSFQLLMNCRFILPASAGSEAAAQGAASVSTPKTRAPGILAASAPASDAPMSPRPMTATAAKGASEPFNSADSVMEVSVSSIDQVPVTTHCIRTNRPRAQTPASAAFSARLSASAMFDRIPFGVIY